MLNGRSSTVNDESLAVRSSLTMVSTHLALQAAQIDCDCHCCYQNTCCLWINLLGFCQLVGVECVCVSVKEERSKGKKDGNGILETLSKGLYILPSSFALAKSDNVLASNVQSMT